MRINNRIGIFCLLGTLLFTVGAMRHLGLGQHDPSTTLFGDTGDGLFNLWILKHVSETFFQGPATLSNGRIFYPDHLNTLWWSDNLLAFAPVYAWWAKVLALPDIAAYWWTILAYSFFGYALVLWLLVEIWKSKENMPPVLSIWGIGLLPVVAYALFFTIPRLIRYAHFQHLSVCFLTLLVIACIRFCRHRTRFNFALILFGCLLLMYSAPYYALVGWVILLLYGFLILAEGQTRPLEFLRTHTATLLTFTLLVQYPLRQYMTAPHQSHPLRLLKAYALQPINLVLPDCNWLHSAVTTALPPEHHPSVEYGYLGAGILIATALCLMWALLQAAPGGA